MRKTRFQPSPRNGFLCDGFASLHTMCVESGFPRWLGETLGGGHGVWVKGGSWSEDRGGGGSCDVGEAGRLELERWWFGVVGGRLVVVRESVG